jgi:hypothetical protein
VLSVKKDKKCLVQTLILALNLSFLPSHGKKWFFIKQLGTSIGCEDVHLIFLTI